MIRTNTHLPLLVAILALAVAVGLWHIGVWHPDPATSIAIGAAGVMSNKGVRVIDPILTNVAQGYKNAEMVGNMLFPQVPVTINGGQIIEFGKESFYKYNARRVPGGATKRIEFGYAGKQYALLQDSLEGKVPREHLRDASVVPGVDLGSRSVNGVMRGLRLALEFDQAAIAVNAANYDGNHKLALAGGTKWSADTGKPSTDIETAKEAVRATIGMDPNTVLLSALAFKAARQNPFIIDRFKYTGRDSITADMLAKLWDVERVVVGKAISMSDQGVASDVWGNNVVVAYTNVGSINAEEPSYGYTYTMEGHPMVEEAYYDNNTKSWIYPVTFERAPVLSGIVAGFLIQNPN